MERIDLKKVRWRYLNLFARLIYYIDKELDNLLFVDFIDSIVEELGLSDSGPITKTLAHLIGRKLDKDKLKDYCWFLSANYHKLKNGESVIFNKFPVQDQLYLFQILNPIKNGQNIQIQLVALSGDIASRRFVVSNINPTSLMRNLYPKLKCIIPPERYDLFEGLIFFGSIEKIGDFIRLDFKKIKCTNLCRSVNNRMLDVRISLRKSSKYCELGKDVLCSICREKCNGRPLKLLE